MVMRGTNRLAPLNPLRSFSVAVRHATFTSAAQEMGITQVAVSRQISILEDYLGVKLFERGASSVKLTEVGKTFGQEIAPLFERIEIATQNLRGANRQTMLNIRVYPTFANYWLMRRLVTFKVAHPEIEIDLDTKVEPLDFRGTYLDFAIQLGHGNWTNCEAIRLFPEEIDVVCSPEYAAKFDGLDTPEKLAQATFLHAHYRRREWETWCKQQGFDIDTQSGCFFRSSTLVYQAAVEGMGVAIAQLLLVEDEVRSGALVRPFKRRTATDQHFWLVWPTTRSVSVHAKRAMDWLLMESGQPTHFFSSVPT